jgi:bacteriocin-like protein
MIKKIFKFKKAEIKPSKSITKLSEAELKKVIGGATTETVVHSNIRQPVVIGS